MVMILKFISDIFDLNVLILFLISSMFLLLLDTREYKKGGFKREYKTAKFFGYFYIAAGIIFYVVAKNIKL